MGCQKPIGTTTTYGGKPTKPNQGSSGTNTSKKFPYALGDSIYFKQWSFVPAGENPSTGWSRFEVRGNNLLVRAEDVEYWLVEGRDVQVAGIFVIDNKVFVDFHVPDPFTNPDYPWFENLGWTTSKWINYQLGRLP